MDVNNTLIHVYLEEDVYMKFSQVKLGYVNCRNPSIVFVKPPEIGTKSLRKLSLISDFDKVKLIIQCSHFGWIPCI